MMLIVIIIKPVNAFFMYSAVFCEHLLFLWVLLRFSAELLCPHSKRHLYFHLFVLGRTVANQQVFPNMIPSKCKVKI